MLLSKYVSMHGRRDDDVTQDASDVTQDVTHDVTHASDDVTQDASDDITHDVTQGACACGVTSQAHCHSHRQKQTNTYDSHQYHFNTAVYLRYYSWTHVNRPCLCVQGMHVCSVSYCSVSSIGCVMCVPYKASSTLKHSKTHCLSNNKKHNQIILRNSSCLETHCDILYWSVQRYQIRRVLIILDYRIIHKEQRRKAILVYKVRIYELHIICT